MFDVNVKKLRLLPSCPERDQRRLPGSGHHHRASISPKYVDFRPDAERFEVEPGIDREPRAGQDTAIVMRLVVIHVDAVSMHAFAEAVPRPVKDVLAVSRLFQDVDGRAIDLPAVQLTAGRLRFL